MSFQGRPVVQAFDGQQAWAVPPMGDGQPAGAARPRRRRQMAQQADFEGALVDYQAKGHQVELVGTEKVRSGTPTGCA